MGELVSPDARWSVYLVQAIHLLRVEDRNHVYAQYNLQLVDGGTEGVGLVEPLYGKRSAGWCHLPLSFADVKREWLNYCSQHLARPRLAVA